MKILMAFLLALLMPLTAIAAEDEDKEKNEEKSLYERYEAIAGEPVGRIRYGRNIQWRPVDDAALLAETQRGRYWLLDIEKGCIRRSPLDITLKGDQRRRQGMSEINQLDALQIDDRRCTVTRIRPLDAEGVRALLADD